MKTITRKEYMQCSSELFQPYYRQFVTEETKSFVLSQIGMEKLKASECPHLNDIVKHSDGGRGNWVWDFAPINLELARELGEVSTGCLPSDSTRTCISKAAARMLLEEQAITS